MSYIISYSMVGRSAAKIYDLSAHIYLVASCLSKYEH